MRRGPEQVVGILAALLAGAAYLPVDAALPAERIRYLLHDGEVRHTLTIDLTKEPNPLKTPIRNPHPDDLAYVLYTSGTTGEPKGVMVTHRSVANVTADCNARFGVGPADRFMAISAFNFDLSVYDVFGALSAGAALVIPDADRAADPAHWLDLCDRFGVTIWNSVPAIVRLLADQAQPENLETLRLVMMSGDRIPPDLPRALQKLKPGLTMMSLGGPTETTIWNISHPIPNDHDGQRIPYGRPNANNRAYILDPEGLDAPDWVTGEICAAGTGLARGYWHDEHRTRVKFGHDGRRDERLYRTGDLGRYLPDGTIDIQGRSDFQIKVNGYRIEAGEVETRLTAIAAIKQAVVVRQPGAHGDRLTAHLVPAGNARPEEDQIRQTLSEHLPGYLIPATVLWHDSLPLTRNGKVDRARLATMAPKPAARPAAENTALHRTLAELWSPVLKVPPQDIGPDSDFYDLGGDSLAAARIFTAVRKKLGVGITLDHLHQVRTVRAMAGFLEAAR
jgi:amino acid adenylation domain-containing protein